MSFNGFKAQTSPKENALKSFSIASGWANPISLFANKDDSSASYFFDFTSKIDSLKFFKLHIKSSLNYEKPILLMQNLLISIGNGKILKQKERKFKWGVGKDAYFKMNLRRFKISKGSRSLWESELYGFGVQCYTFYDKYLINDWWLNVSCYLNLGLNQTFITSSTNNNSAQEVWAFKLGANQLLNLGLKKTF
jgi:hypothetical protein